MGWGSGACAAGDAVRCSSAAHRLRMVTSFCVLVKAYQPHKRSIALQPPRCAALTPQQLAASPTAAAPAAGAAAAQAEQEAREWNKALVKQLQACTSREQLVELVAAGAERMDAQSVASAVHAASGFVSAAVSSRYWVHDVMSRHLEPLLVPRLAAMDAGGLTITTAALARLGHVDAHLCEQICHHAGCALLLEEAGGSQDGDGDGSSSSKARVTPRMYAQLLWGLAKLGHVPEAAWLQRWLAGMQPALGSFRGQDFANVLWALARLRYVPAAPWLAAFFAAMQQQLGSCDAQALSNVAWALGQLRCSPPREWMSAFMQQSRRQLARFQPPGLAMLAFALATAEQPPSAEWATAFVAACERHLPACSPQNLALLLMAAANWGVQPAAAWRRAFLAQSYSSLEHFSAPQLAALTHHMAHMGWRPPSPWMAKLEACTAARLATFDAKSLTRLSSALAKMQHAPSDAWCAAYLERLGALVRLGAGGLTGSQLAATLHALTRLRLRPDVPLLEALLARCAQCFADLDSVQQLAWCLQACAAWWRRPDAAWLDAFFAAAARLLQWAGPKELVMLMLPATSLGIAPPPSTMAPFYAACLRHLHALRLEDRLLPILQACVQLQLQPPEAWLQAVGARIHGPAIWKAQLPVAVATASALAHMGYYQAPDACGSLFARLDDVWLSPAAAAPGGGNEPGGGKAPGAPLLAAVPDIMMDARQQAGLLLDLVRMLPLLRLAPSPAWLEPHLRACVLASGAWTAGEHVELLSALSQLRALSTQLSASLARLCATGLALVPHLSPPQLSQALVAAVALQHQFSCQQLAQLVDAVERALPELEHADAVDALQAVLRMQLAPALAGSKGAGRGSALRSMLQHQLITACSRSPPPASAPVLLRLLRALQQAGHSPSQELLQQHAQVANRQSVLRCFSAAERQELDKLYTHFRFECAVAGELLATEAQQPDESLRPLPASAAGPGASAVVVGAAAAAADVSST